MRKLTGLERTSYIMIGEYFPTFRKRKHMRIEFSYDLLEFRKQMGVEITDIVLRIVSNTEQCEALW